MQALRRGLSAKWLQECTLDASPALSARAFAMVPYVTEMTPRGERVADIFSRLLQDRIICVYGEVTEPVAAIVVAQLLQLESVNPDKPIQMYINSPGGSVTDGLAIYDTMNYIKSPVETFCMGQAASMGSFLLAAGAPGKRHVLPNARIMLHQPIGGTKGQVSDIEIAAKELIRMKRQLTEILAKNTGQPVDVITEKCDRDFWMSAEEARDFGIVDHVMINRTAELV